MELCCCAKALSTPPLFKLLRSRRLRVNISRECRLTSVGGLKMPDELKQVFSVCGGVDCRNGRVRGPKLAMASQERAATDHRAQSVCQLTILGTA